MSRRQPKVGFVSLGCPKALVDSERIITQLRAEGYEVAPSYDAADVVVVNTCGFIDSAVDESLDAIGEALEQNGKVIVTGCLGARPERILERHPKVLKVTGPQAYEDVLGAVHEHLPPKHDPFVDLVPPQGIKLTPRHYAYLKISEGCNNKCSFCIIPSMRGLLVSRSIDDVLREGEKLARAGVKELLVISQDTSAYGVDLRYREAEWRGRKYQTRFLDLAKGLGELGIWVRMHYVYPYPHVDDVIPLMAERKVLPYLDIPFQHGSPAVLKRMKRPGMVEKTLNRINAWRAVCPDLTIRSTFIVGFPGETGRSSRNCWPGWTRHNSTAWARSSTRRWKARPRTTSPRTCRMTSRRNAWRVSCGSPRPSARPGWRTRWASGCRCWSTLTTAILPSRAAWPTRPKSTAS
jgi:ribosomal protein S12 methylthiotransferase